MITAKNAHVCATNERGQMTIFIALIFQVLFVFFAMIINVGLIVHDKINLQNSVDLAAYYGAQRQAEVLNAIAHENYQIRQAWKLLAWRIRVLGDMANQNNPMYLDKQLQSNDLNAQDIPIQLHPPAICVITSAWDSNENLCYNSQIQIPSLPIVPIILPAPWNFIAQAQSTKLKENAGNDCSTAGPRNFIIAASWMGAYRAQIAQAKQAIRTYAQLLANGKDIRGEDIKEGAKQTIINNLTRANKESLMQFANSIGGLDIKDWLHEIAIKPSVYFANLISEKSGGGCTGEPKIINEAPKLSNLSPYNSDPAILAWINENDDENDLHNSSLGYEKNPWYMVFYGVTAQSKPRKPYLPFGEAITLTGKAYAKPFGGRIGPWYYQQWQPTENRSTGNFQQKIDSLVPADTADLEAAGSNAEILNAQVPNYARYPGDPIGLNSRLAIILFKNQIIPKIKSGAPIHLGSYAFTPTNNDGLANSGDALGIVPDSSLGYKAPWIRTFEVAAIAPDLFDITYYSIDPNFALDYLKDAQKFLPQDQMPYDIGNGLGRVDFNIKNQIEQAKNLADPTGYWIVRDWHNLLTGWMPAGAFNYVFPSSFGKCTAEATSVPTPGACAQGGRVGYSVKIVSEKYLKSSNLELGGSGITGAIKNPPQ